MAKSIPQVKIGNEIYEIKDTTAREHLVEVSASQPTFPDNKLWINDQEAEYEIPTMAEFGDLKSAIDDIDTIVYRHETVDFSELTTTPSNISPSTNKWASSNNYKNYFVPIPNGAEYVTITKNATNDTYYAVLKTNSRDIGDVPDYATGHSVRETVSNGEDTFAVPSDAHYLWVSGTINSVNRLPSSLVFVFKKQIPEVDATLTKSGDAADAKATGDKITSINNTIGMVVTASFTKPATGNAVKNFQYPVKAGRKIKFYWTGDDVSDQSTLNLYSRETSSGENVETLRSTAYANVIYTVTPTVDANYLRVVATRSGTIYVYDADTYLDDINTLEKDVANLKEKAIEIPFVQFGFVHDMYDPSAIFGESGEIGNINGWSSKAEALTKVHDAFDALCASGGAGYGFGSRIYAQSGATKLYKESDGDTALIDVLAPAYVTQGVTQGQTVSLPIGTDSGGDPVTYSYTYESSTQPYEVRLYRFHDTNSALHTQSTDIPKKKILLVGGTHGNEFCAPINLYVLAKHLCSDYSNPDVLKLRSSFDVYIIPYLNGFGCQYRWNNGGTVSTGTRSNGRLVDINRNCYTNGWTGATGTAAQITTYFENQIANLATNTFPGCENGSEFEGALVKGLIEYLKPDVFIDHHHNSGNTPFYTTCRGNYAGNLIYQAANDTAYARMHNMPEYFGTKYNLFLGSDVSPATKAAANGHMQTMAYELGVKMNAVSEMPESIAYLNGVVDSTTKSATKYSALAFKQAEYTLLNVALHFCQWAMEH